MKKYNYIFILLLIVVSGLVFANREIFKETSNNTNPKTLTSAEKNAVMKKWEASPDGVKYKKWEASSAGKKVNASAAKISKSISDYSSMEGVITSLSLPTGSRLGFGMMIKINGEDYILSFGIEKINEFNQLHSLKVNDKIIIKSHFVSHAPKYAYPIIAGDYIEHHSKIIFKRALSKGGC